MTKGTALETVTTGEDGKASYSVDLPISNGYYVSETQAPYAYIRNSKDVYSFNFNVLPETQAKASFSHTFVNDRTTAKIHIYNRVRGYQDLAERMRAVAASKNANLSDVTISKKLIIEENDHAVKTRIPGTWGDEARYVWLRKENIMDMLCRLNTHGLRL